MNEMKTVTIGDKTYEIVDAKMREEILQKQPKGDYATQSDMTEAVEAVEKKIPTVVSQLENDKGYLTEHQDLSGYAKKNEIPTTLPASDVYEWAKQPEKPTYTAEEVKKSLGYTPADSIVTDKLSEEIVEIKNNAVVVTYDETTKTLNISSVSEGVTASGIKELTSKYDVEKILLNGVELELSQYATQKELDELKAMGGLTIPIVDSVDDMKDTSRQYVLKGTGTIWEWKETTYTKENVVRDEVIGTYERGRFSSSGTNAGDVQTHTITPFVDITKSAYRGKTIQIHLEGNKYASDSAETYIMTSLFDSEKNNILPRAYTTQVSGGLITAITNGILTINSEKNAILSLNIPCVEKATEKEIGYMRFCGLGTADGTVYITYTDKQIVTENKWIDTGVSYGGSSIDKETLEKISVLNNEGEDATSIQLLPSPVLNFYNADAYSDDDYTVSHLSKITYPCRADIPVPFTVKWNHNEDAMRTTVAVDTKPIGNNNQYSLKTHNATGFDNYPLYNLLPSTTYYYKVTHVLADGSIVEAKSGSFTTSNESVRLLYVDGTQNVRDLGGWAGLNGKKLRYGKIIRGAALSDSSFPSLIITGNGRLALSELKVQAELNLGATDQTSEIAQNCEYKKVYYTNYATAITEESYRAMFKTLLEWIVDCLNNSKTIYMHCQGGCDRTGTLSFLLLGLLGVSESDLAKEYELSSFSDIGFGRLRTTTKAVDTYDYVGMVEALKKYSGDTITDKFYDFATVGCGISEDTITQFRNNMLS